MPLKLSPDAVSRRLGDSAVIIRMSTDRIYELNATGAWLWDLLQSGASVESAVDTLTRGCSGDSETIRTDVHALVARLREEGLVVES